MRFPVVGSVVLLVALAGCDQPETQIQGCEAPDTADKSTEPYDYGVALYTVRTGDKVTAWACNEIEEERWLLSREEGCPGSWSWTYEEDGTVTDMWPEETNYADCDDKWVRLGPGEGVSKQMELGHPPEDGSLWIIRLQVYENDEMLEDGGGGPVHARYE